MRRLWDTAVTWTGGTLIALFLGVVVLAVVLDIFGLGDLLR